MLVLSLDSNIATTPAIARNKTSVWWPIVAYGSMTMFSFGLVGSVLKSLRILVYVACWPQVHDVVTLKGHAQGQQSIKLKFENAMKNHIVAL